MYELSFPLASPAERGPLAPASRLRSRCADPDGALQTRLAQVYGEDPAVLADRARAMVQTLDRFLEGYGDLPCALYRAPARISLNPHSDHQGAWVPYGLHARELLTAVAPTVDESIHVRNVDPQFAELLSFCPTEEIARDRSAWEAGWFQYLEAPGVVEEVRRNLDAKTQTTGRRATINYVRAAALRMRHARPDAPLPGLRMVLNGNIAQGGGQSSSSAVVVTTALALAQFGGAPEDGNGDRRLLAEQCGEAEWYVGTRGGSGDQAAMLLGTRAGLTHLCFRAPFGIRGVSQSFFPSRYQLILANSQTRSEKSAEERLLFNRGIFAYKFAFLALKQEMGALGLDRNVIEGTESLGDMHTGRIAAADLYRLLLRLPASATPAELARRFPQVFPGAARGCFGTEDPERLPAEIPLRGAAVYGLGRVDRGLQMLGMLHGSDRGTMREFGRLMTITHDGDRLFTGEGPYLENRERLADEVLGEALAAVLRGEERPLRHEPGFYGASIRELDRMVDVALHAPGVLGAGLMGAGGGGYILILADRGAFEGVRQRLVREYYEPFGKEPDVEAWHPTAAACRLL